MRLPFSSIKQFQWLDRQKNGQPVCKMAHFRTSKWLKIRVWNRGIGDCQPVWFKWLMSLIQVGHRRLKIYIKRSFCSFYQIRSFSSPCTWLWTIRLIVKHWTKLSSKMKYKRNRFEWYTDRFVVITGIYVLQSVFAFIALLLIQCLPIIDVLHDNSSKIWFWL